MLISFDEWYNQWPKKTIVYENSLTRIWMDPQYNHEQRALIVYSTAYSIHDVWIEPMDSKPFKVHRFHQNFMEWILTCPIF